MTSAKFLASSLLVVAAPFAQGAVACSPCASLVVDSAPGAAHGSPFIIGKGKYEIAGLPKDGLFFNSGGKVWFYDGTNVREIATGTGHFPLPALGVYWTVPAGGQNTDIFYGTGETYSIQLFLNGMPQDILPDGRMIVRGATAFYLVTNEGISTLIPGLFGNGSGSAIYAGGWIYNLETSNLRRIRPNLTGLSLIINNPGGYTQKHFVASSRFYFRTTMGIYRVNPESSVAQQITSPDGNPFDVSDLFTSARAEFGTVGFTRYFVPGSNWTYWNLDTAAVASTPLHTPVGGCGDGWQAAGIEFEQREVVFKCSVNELSWTNGQDVKVNFAGGNISSSTYYLENRPRGARVGETLYAIIGGYSPIGRNLAAMRPAESLLTRFTDIGADVNFSSVERVFGLNGRLVFAATTPASGTELFVLDPEPVFKSGFEVN